MFACSIFHWLRLSRHNQTETRVADVCSLRIPGWHDRALYPLAGRRAAPPVFFLVRAREAEPSAAAADFFFANGAAAVVGGGGARAQRATGSTSPPAAVTDMCSLTGVSDVCSLRDSRLARSRSLSVGGAAPRAAGFLFGICHGRRATGSTSPPAACTGKVMARVDHFCELRARARRSRARRPFFFLRIRLVAAVAPSTASYGVAVAAGGLHRQADGSRVDHFCELRARARRSRARRPFFFLRIRLVAAVAPSTASYGVAVAAGGLHRQADGSRPCARAKISAVHFIRWRYGAERRAGLSNNREQGDC